MSSPDAPQSPKLLDRVRQTCRRRQYSYHTEKAYVRWVERFVRFHDTTHPRRLNADVEWGALSNPFEFGVPGSEMRTTPQ